MTDQSTDQTTGHEVAPVDAAVSGPPADEGNTENLGDTIDATHEIDEPETFPREYVNKLRDESAKYRQRAADRDALAERLHAALVTITGRLADPSDLPFDEAHLTDDRVLSAALDDLLARKPHLASRRPIGDVGQGVGPKTAGLDLAGLLRANAS